MVQNSKEVSSLRESSAKAKAACDSLTKLLKIARLISNGQDVDTTELKMAQKQALLDSFKVKKLHRDHKEWENATKEQFVEKEIKAYNRKYAQISRLHSANTILESKYAELRKSVQLPKFHFSIQTLEQFEGGKLLQYLKKDSAGNYPRKVQVSEIFSLDRNSVLPNPEFAEFNKLVNLEYRLRMRMQIKYEVLLRVKSHLTAKNSQWSARDSLLNQFITRDLAKMIAEVEKIKTSEYEDLKYYEDDFDMESEEHLEESRSNDELEGDMEPDAEHRGDGELDNNHEEFEGEHVPEAEGEHVPEVEEESKPDERLYEAEAESPKDEEATDEQSRHIEGDGEAEILQPSDAEKPMPERHLQDDEMILD